MSILASSLRSLWAPGLNEITGNVATGINGWVAEGDYQIYQPVKANQFSLTMADSQPFLLASASDINRTASAAFESISSATKNELFPKSSAWILIKSYYAAYFAAHAVTRMLGTAFVTLERPQTAAINKIANLFGNWQQDLPTGTFHYRFISHLDAQY